jgi:pimeloyl-ACP methyl ester carboxylesterase
MTTKQTGYAPVNGLNMYYEIHGDGRPTVLLHGGLGLTEMFAPVLPQLAAGRQVIAADMQGHGRTADIDRPLGLEQMGDDVAALLDHLDIGQADVVGYSMGAGAALRLAIQHPQRVRKLALVSFPFRRSAWHAENLAGMDQMGAGAAEFMRNTPIYAAYTSVAPDPDHFPALLDKIGDLMRRDYDWSPEVAKMAIPTLLAFGDADSVAPAHAAEFFGLLGGGKRDGSWDNSGMVASRLAIMPATTHYNIFDSPALIDIVVQFLDAPAP